MVLGVHEAVEVRVENARGPIQPYVLVKGTYEEPTQFFSVLNGHVFEQPNMETAVLFVAKLHWVFDVAYDPVAMPFYQLLERVVFGFHTSSCEMFPGVARMLEVFLALELAQAGVHGVPMDGVEGPEAAAAGVLDNVMDKVEPLLDNDDEVVAPVRNKSPASDDSVVSEDFTNVREKLVPAAKEEMEQGDHDADDTDMSSEHSSTGRGAHGRRRLASSGSSDGDGPEWEANDEKPTVPQFPAVSGSAQRYASDDDLFDDTDAAALSVSQRYVPRRGFGRTSAVMGARVCQSQGNPGRRGKGSKNVVGRVRGGKRGGGAKRGGGGKRQSKTGDADLADLAGSQEI